MTKQADSGFESIEMSLSSQHNMDLEDHIERRLGTRFRSPEQAMAFAEENRWLWWIRKVAPLNPVGRRTSNLVQRDDVCAWNRSHYIITASLRDVGSAASLWPISGRHTDVATASHAR
jgi:hypothetical protein